MRFEFHREIMPSTESYTSKASTLDATDKIKKGGDPGQQRRAGESERAVTARSLDATIYEQDMRSTRHTHMVATSP